MNFDLCFWLSKMTRWVTYRTGESRPRPGRSLFEAKPEATWFCLRGFREGCLWSGASSKLFLNLVILFCSNSVTNLHHLTSHSTTSCPTTWRLLRRQFTLSMTLSYGATFYKCFIQTVSVKCMVAIPSNSTRKYSGGLLARRSPAVLDVTLLPVASRTSTNEPRDT